MEFSDECNLKHKYRLAHSTNLEYHKFSFEYTIYTVLKRFVQNSKHELLFCFLVYTTILVPYRRMYTL